MRPAVVAALALLACHPPSAAPSNAPRTTWVVIAPHPDDETLIAGGVLARATAAGESVAVVVMTNGDFDCVHDGLGREGESIAGLTALGVPEDRVFFLGYPDGGLPRLGDAPLAAKRIEDGRCTTGSTTYGARGRGRHDVHSARFGAPASYTRGDAVRDLATVLGELRPENVVLTHPSDTHPDHATTYALFRSALDLLPEAPRVHRAIVHNGDCWPTGVEPGEPCPLAHLSVDEPMPPLSGRLRGYVARERVAVPSSCRAHDPNANPKLRAIGAHASQTRGDTASYLFSFARADEAFFPETYERDGTRWRRAGSSGRSARTAMLGSTLALDVGEHRLEVDPANHEATLRRSGQVREVWPLAHDLWRTGAEPFTLEVDSRADDAVVEITLRVRGEVVGVAIDVSASPSARPAP